MVHFVKYLVTLLLFAFHLSVTAAENDLKLIALFKNSVMVEYNGKQKMLRKGQSLSSEIKLVNVDKSLATFSINGEEVQLGLNRNMVLSESYSAPSQSNTQTTNGAQTVQILRNLQGMYETPGFINGRTVHFVVDTGATLVAMDEQDAIRLGVPFRTEGRIGYSSTANGTIKVWQVNLKKVRVGTIELTNVRGSVREGSTNIPILLGQSFLNQLKVESDNGLLKLSKKF